MNTVSHCHHAPTERIRRTPQDPEYRHMSEIATICSKCRQDCDEIPACDGCGEPGELTRIGRYDYCAKCAAEEIQVMNEGVGA